MGPTPSRYLIVEDVTSLVFFKCGKCIVRGVKLLNVKCKLHFMCQRWCNNSDVKSRLLHKCYMSIEMPFK